VGKAALDLDRDVPIKCQLCEVRRDRQFGAK